MTLRLKTIGSKLGLILPVSWLQMLNNFSRMNNEDGESTYIYSNFFQRFFSSLSCPHGAPQMVLQVPMASRSCYLVSPSSERQLYTYTLSLIALPLGMPSKKVARNLTKNTRFSSESSFCALRPQSEVFCFRRMSSLFKNVMAGV